MNIHVLAADADAADLLMRFKKIRDLSVDLAAPLEPEDLCVQSMPDASPVKWHLAHTSWFFEAVLLLRHDPSYVAFDQRFLYLYNSYYEALGPRHPRPQRGLITRPTASQVLAYRHHVDAAVTTFLHAADPGTLAAVASVVELGLNHEQQHQELILTDIKHAFFCNPTFPVYGANAGSSAKPSSPAPPLAWVEMDGGIAAVGHSGPGFAFDSEGPRHDVLLHPFRLASRPVTCAEYLQFMNDDGYRRAEFWLSDGWGCVKSQGWDAPLYWLLDDDGGWQTFTLNGLRPVDPAEPVAHVSIYEAAAYAEWAGHRLPTEFEWEAAAVMHPQSGRPLDIARPHPAPAGGGGLTQMYGEVWQWTRSSYDPYPGFKPLPGPAKEYNGKFMVGQVVLRGSSCFTPPGHTRPTYRNFFPPASRWQASGIRLASDR